MRARYHRTSVSSAHASCVKLHIKERREEQVHWRDCCEAYLTISTADYVVDKCDVGTDGENLAEQCAMWRISQFDRTLSLDSLAAQVHLESEDIDAAQQPSTNNQPIGSFCRMVSHQIPFFLPHPFEVIEVVDSIEKITVPPLHKRRLWRHQSLFITAP